MPIPPSETHRDAPLIVTALIGQASFEILDALRRCHFPAALNRVPAHVSLFHHLPGRELRSVLATIGDRCRDQTPVELVPQGVRFLGRGVAIAYPAEPLAVLHAALALAWRPWLTAQDQQPFRPHVTIQNKVGPDVARRLCAELQGSLLPTCRVEGLSVWRYLDGPWDPVASCRFGTQSGDTTR